MSDLNAAVRNDINADFDAALNKIKHCLSQLTMEQVWWRPAPSMNSIGNLLLHLAGNVRQWIVCGVGNVASVRQRQSEFDERGPLPTDELLAKLESVMAEAQETVRGVADDDLLRERRVQGHEVTALQAALHALTHFHGHTQEIVSFTRLQLGDDYQFDFVPTPEQA